jgi:hypothetical protein
VRHQQEENEMTPDAIEPVTHQLTRGSPRIATGIIVINPTPTTCECGGWFRR